MVRVNIISPRKLADQHLIAEYLEIMMLLGYVRKNPSVEGIPENYKLGEGHIKFFKNKLLYLKKRHDIIRKEMQRRGFTTNVKISLGKFPKHLKNDWKAREEDFKIIEKRIMEKLCKKPEFYRYCRVYRKPEFFKRLMKRK